MTRAQKDSIHSLRNRLILVAIAGTFAASFLAAGTGLFSSFQRRAETEREKLEYAAEHLAYSVGNILRESVHTARSYSTGPLAKIHLIEFNAERADRESYRFLIRKDVEDLMGPDSRILGITRLDGTGRIAATAGAEFPQETWPDKALTSDQPEIGRLFYRIKYHPHFAISVPIFDEKAGRIGTDIVFFDGKLLLIQLPVSGQQEQGTAFLATGPDDAMIFLGRQGVVEASQNLISARLAAKDASGALRLDDHLYGFASTGQTNWAVLIETSPIRFFSRFRDDLANALAVTILVTALTASIVSMLLRPLAKGLVVRAETLEAKIESRTRELRRQKTLVENILENVPHGVFWKDRDGVYLGCSPVFVKERGSIRRTKSSARLSMIFGICWSRWTEPLQMTRKF